MWQTYSIRSIKQNQTTSFFLAAIAFIAATLLSLVTAVFYNIWMDTVQRNLLNGKDAPQWSDPLVLAYSFVLLVMCVSLVAMIHNAFDVSMNARVHQLGILQSVGATPKQIRTFLVQEAFILCTLPLLLGVLAGIGLSYGFLQLITAVTAPIRQYDVAFYYSIEGAVLAFVLGLVTVWFSVWIPARKMGRLAPLAAIYYGSETAVAKMKRFRLASTLFGVEGELARKSLYARRRSLRTATISLTLAFLGFISFLNLETISRLSTAETYFERYRDTWDLLLTADGRWANQDSWLSQLRQLPEVSSAIAYKKAAAFTHLPEVLLSPELVSLGGLTAVAPTISPSEPGHYLVSVPIWVLDNDSFADYAAEFAQPTAVGQPQTILVNTIWDSLHSDRLNRTYVPYLNSQTSLSFSLVEDGATPSTDGLPITVDAIAQQPPQLKESAAQYSLLLIVSESAYANLEARFPFKYSYVNLLATHNEQIEQAAQQVATLLADEPTAYIIDNRLQEEASDKSMRNALRLVIGLLAGLLSLIGLANLFSSTLGQIQQRKREFARYLSVGVSPKGIMKIMGLEGLMVVTRPFLLSLLVNIPVVALALQASSVAPSDFLAAVPLLPTAVFLLWIVAAVAVAYYLGSRTIYRQDIIGTLKDETML